MAAIRRFYKWFARSGFNPDQPAPIEAIVLRCIGVLALALFLLATVLTRPRPGVDGRVLIPVAGVAMIAAVLASQPLRPDVPTWRRIAALTGVTVSAAVLAAIQSNGIWQAAPYFVAIIAAFRLQRLPGLLTLVTSIVVLAVVTTIAGRGGVMLSIALGAIPWFLVIRLISALREQRDALEASRAAEARAAAAAERGRLAREMHDVLAHSLSALALQLESTRLLARDRSVDDAVTRAIDQAHRLAAGGLDEARRAIAAERGDELPGPERIGVLAEAFGEQSGLPVDVEIRGPPHDLAPEARLAVYRTAQEALTNIRRHATAERVQVMLDYLPHSTVLVVQDHAIDGSPPAAAVGLTGGYGLTGMRERAELLGGELLAAPTPGGFRVELRLPAGE